MHLQTQGVLMNQFLSNKIIAGIVAIALLVGVGILVSSGDTSSTTRNAALVVATPCTKPGQVTKISKQSVVCATTNSGSLWYATMKAKGKAQACTKPGAIRKKSKIVWVCGVVKKKKLWQATQPLPPAVVASTTVIEPGASQPTPALDSTQVATPETPVVADNTVLADPQIPEDKIVTQVIDDVTTPPASTPPASTPPASTPPASTPLALSLACAAGGACAIGETGPGGGKVFYVAPTQQPWGRYLEVAPTDYQVNNVRAKVAWGCSGTSPDSTAKGIGTGKANTDMILAMCKTVGIAADVANKYSTSTAGAGQWFLPSRDELNQMYINRVAIGGFLNAADYWSSSASPAVAWFQVFGLGSQYFNGKNYTSYVRPVRAFSQATCATGGDCAVGDTGPGGGKVFYATTTPFDCGVDLNAKCKYLEAAPSDQPQTNWCSNTSDSLNVTSTAIGAGMSNTTTADRTCTSGAIQVTADYTNNDKDDWYLPSKDELNELCKYARNTGQAAGASMRCKDGSLRGGFAADYYWSSSEFYASLAWVQYFNSGSQGSNGKHLTFYVRPVRAF